MSGIEATAAWPALSALLVWLTALGFVAYSGHRNTLQDHELNARLASVLGDGVRVDLSQPALVAMADALERLSDEATKRQAEAEQERKARADLYTELWNLRDLLATLQADAKKARDLAEEQQAKLAGRIAELEIVAAQVPKLIAERDEAVRKAASATERVGHLEREVEVLRADLAQLRGEVEKKA